MSSTGVRESNDTNKRVIKGLILNEAQFIQSLRVFANTSTLSGLGATGTETNNSPLEASGNYLAKSGDIMIGQLGNAFDTIAATNIVNDILDVSKATGTTFPIVILQGESPPTADDLVTITQGEDVFSFQELVIRTRSSIITIKNSDNINTPDGNDLVLPVGSIIHLYFDTFLGEWVIDGGTPFFSSGGGGDPNTPWTENQDAANFALNNVSSIQISDSIGGVHSLLQGLAGVGTRLTLTAGETFQIFDNITNILEITNTFGMDLKQHDLFGVTGIDLDGTFATIQGVANLDFFQASHSINSLSGVLLYQVDSTDFHGFFAGGVEIARFEDIATVLSLDMKIHQIKNIKHLDFDETTTVSFANTAVAIGYDSGDAELRYNVPTAGEHIIQVNAIDIVTISAGNMVFVDGYQVIFNPDTTNPGVNVGLVVGDPSATNNGDLWYNASTDKLRTKENGVNVDVIGGGAQTPWLSTIDADGNDLENLGRTEYATGLFGASTDPFSVYDGANLRWHVPTGDGFVWTIGAFDQILGLGGSVVNVFKVLDMQNANKIINVNDPTADQDVVTRKFLEDNPSIPSGVQDARIWTTHETAEFDFEVWLTNNKNGDIGSSIPLADDTAFYIPIWVGDNVTLREIGIDVTVAGAATVTLAIYDSEDTQNYPRTRIDFAISVNGISLGTGIRTLTFFEALSPGLYWLLVRTDTGISIRQWNPDAAVSVGHFPASGVTGAMAPISGYFDDLVSSTPDATADNDMSVLNGNTQVGIPAIYARFD